MEFQNIDENAGRFPPYDANVRNFAGVLCSILTNVLYQGSFLFNNQLEVIECNEVSKYSGLSDLIFILARSSALANEDATMPLLKSQERRLWKFSRL